MFAFLYEILIQYACQVFINDWRSYLLKIYNGLLVIFDKQMTTAEIEAAHKNVHRAQFPVQNHYHSLLFAKARTSLLEIRHKSSLKALFGKCASGMRFEVLFELCSFFTGAKCYGRFNSPRTIFGGVGYLTVIMGFDPGFQIFRETSISTSLVSFTG